MKSKKKVSCLNNTFKSVMPNYITIPIIIFVSLDLLDMLMLNFELPKPYYSFLGLFIDAEQTLMMVYKIPAIIAYFILVWVSFKFLRIIDEEEKDNASI
jgi:hypothetical protein